jgi:hypothetical protein
MRICRAARALCDVADKNPVALEECRLAAKDAIRQGIILESEVKAAKANLKFAAIAKKLFL